MSVSTDEQRIRNLFERVETIEEVAVSLPQGDDRRTRLLALSRDALAEEATVRPVIAAKILGLSEKTVRAWADAGLLTPTQRSPRTAYLLIEMSGTVRWRAGEEARISGPSAEATRGKTDKEKATD